MSQEDEELLAKDEFETNKAAVLERNPEYEGTDKPRVAAVEQAPEEENPEV